MLDDNLTIRQAGLENGSMLYITVSESGPVGHESKQKVITKDGEIISKPYEEVLSKDGFRPGMLSLRAMKMKWTLNEYVELDSKFVYKLKKQDETVAKKVLLDTKSFEEFQGYMRTLDYRRIRIGYLYGHVKPDNEVVVDFIYEPPQESTDMHFKLLDNEEEVRIS